jgi:hypothetical protein
VFEIKAPSGPGRRLARHPACESRAMGKPAAGNTCASRFTALGLGRRKARPCRCRARRDAGGLGELKLTAVNSTRMLPLTLHRQGTAETRRRLRGRRSTGGQCRCRARDPSGRSRESGPAAGSGGSPGPPGRAGGGGSTGPRRGPWPHWQDSDARHHAPTRRPGPHAALDAGAPGDSSRSSRPARRAGRLRPARLRPPARHGPASGRRAAGVRRRQ